MTEAWIIDACRTPRGIGKYGKGALAEHPSAAARRDRAEGARRAQRHRHRRRRRHRLGHRARRSGQQGGDLGRMAALDAGYDIKSSGVTLDRFCGSGITAVNMAAASIMSGMEDLVIAGGTEMMSMPSRRSADGRPADDGQRQPASARAASAVAPGRLRRRHRHPGRHHRARRSTICRCESQQRADHAINERPLRPRASCRCYHEDGTLALDREEFPRPQTTREGLAALKPSFAGDGRLRRSTTTARPIAS